MSLHRVSTDLLAWKTITISRISRQIYENMGIFHNPNTVNYFTFGIVISYEYQH